MSRLRGVIFIFMTALIWAVMPLTFKFILSHVSIYTIVGINFSSAAVSLLVILLIIDRKGLVSALRGFKPLMIVGGAILGVQLLIFMTGLRLTTGVAAQILNQTEGIYFAVWGFIFFHERITLKKLLGIALAGVGVFVVSWNGADLSVLVSSEYFVGNMIVLFASFVFAIYMALQKRFSTQGVSIPNLFPMFVIASLVTIWLVPVDEVTSLGIGAVGALCLTGVVIAASYIFFAGSMDHVSNSTISVMMLASPIIAFTVVYVSKLLNFSFFAAEFLTVYILVGAAGIIIGAFLVISEEGEDNQETGGEDVTPEKNDKKSMKG